VLRFGHLPDSDMIARQVAMLERLTCAAPNYFERHGRPTDPGALDGHRMIGLRSLTTGRLRPMEFVIGGTLKEITLPVTMSVTGPESYLATARLGLGLVQVPRFHVETDLARGTLIQVLAGYPPPSVPVSLLYPRNRQLSPRVRVFIDWLMRAFGRA
jgi:DNA-binding transcriptional LysR family regulator